MAHELIVLFTVLNGCKQIKRDIIICNTRKLEIQVSMLSIDFTGQSHTRSCIHHLWLLLPSKDRAEEMWQRTIRPTELNMCTFWPSLL